jgi:hypothetical protein
LARAASPEIALVPPAVPVGTVVKGGRLVVFDVDVDVAAPVVWIGDVVV